jgi:AraC-like DNA-binding protein
MTVSPLLRELILQARKFPRLNKKISAERRIVDMGRLCKDCGASKRTIQRLFLGEAKMTFGKWRQQPRLLRARELLASGEKVTAAAAEAGYNSTSAFISMFRKQLGTTPTRYFARRQPAADKLRSEDPQAGRTADAVGRIGRLL